MHFVYGGPRFSMSHELLATVNDVSCLRAWSAGRPHLLCCFEELGIEPEAHVRQALFCWFLEVYFVFCFEAESHCVVQVASASQEIGRAHV